MSMQLWTWNLMLRAVSLPIATLGMSSQLPTFLALPTNCLFRDQGLRHREGQVWTHTKQQVAVQGPGHLRFRSNPANIPLSQGVQH